ncbi:MAG TPA: esterase-like activity of phytase family protein [Dongiaceae bacterium]|jgi:hypothetical protein
MRKIFLACFLLVAGSAAQADEITVTAKPVPLNPADPQQTRVDALEFVAGLELTSTAPEWGGYSGMTLREDGSDIGAVSDVGHELWLDLKHDPDGKLIGVGIANVFPLLDESGRRVAEKEWSDAEAFALVPQHGAAYVAFERNHRLWRYRIIADASEAPAQAVEIPQEIATLPENAGIEALLIDERGMLLIAESGNPDGTGRGWVKNGQEWRTVSIERSDGFEPTDVAAFDDRFFVLLERRYNAKDGPAARISLLPRSLDGDPVAGNTLAVLRLPLSVDNFEAIATRPAADGGRYIYILSDNNQNPQQRTLLLQFRLARP